MLLGNTGTPVNTYYPTAGAKAQSPPVASSTGITGTAQGSVSQTASGSVSFASNPGVWTAVLVGVTFLILHKGGIVE